MEEDRSAALVAAIIGVILFYILLQLLITTGFSWAGIKEELQRIFDERKRRFYAYCADKRQVGFTLIELGIVLVIIALIVGGVLVGQDLIKAAQIRATVSQFEKYNAAANTFRLKYGELPGDIQNAVSFGFVPRAGTQGRGDGNGLIEGGYATGVVPCGETVMFWSDLTTANLIDGNFQGGDGSPAFGNCTGSSPTLPVSQIIPDAKLGQGNSIVIYAENGQNYYQIISGVPVVASGNTFMAKFG